MEKIMKEYIKPEIDIVRLDMQSNILAGSGGVVEVTFDGGEEDDGYAYDLPTDFPTYIDGVGEDYGLSHR